MEIVPVKFSVISQPYMVKNRSIKALELINKKVLMSIKEVLRWQKIYNNKCIITSDSIKRTAHTSFNTYLSARNEKEFLGPRWIKKCHFLLHFVIGSNLCRFKEEPISNLGVVKTLKQSFRKVKQKLQQASAFTE